MTKHVQSIPFNNLVWLKTLNFGRQMTTTKTKNSNALDDWNLIRFWVPFAKIKVSRDSGLEKSFLWKYGKWKSLQVQQLDCLLFLLLLIRHRHLLRIRRKDIRWRENYNRLIFSNFFSYSFSHHLIRTYLSFHIFFILFIRNTNIYT